MSAQSRRFILGGIGAFLISAPVMARAEWLSPAALYIDLTDIDLVNIEFRYWAECVASRLMEESSVSEEDICFDDLVAAIQQKENERQEKLIAAMEQVEKRSWKIMGQRA